MTAEDFSYFAQRIPACYWRLGTKIKDKQITNLHTANFDVDEQCLEYGMGLSALFAIKGLE
jgi:amidohydrolase